MEDLKTFIFSIDKQTTMEMVKIYFYEYRYVLSRDKDLNWRFWGYTAINVSLSENFMEGFENEFGPEWVVLSLYQEMSIEFIEKHFFKLGQWQLLNNVNISDETKLRLSCLYDLRKLTYSPLRETIKAIRRVNYKSKKILTEDEVLPYMMMAKIIG